MYVGDTGPFGLHHLAYVTLDAMMRRDVPERISVRLFSSGRVVISAVVPVENPKSVCEVLEKGSLNFRDGLGELVMVSALSSSFFLGQGGSAAWSWSGRRGLPATDVELPEPYPGVTVAFVPDPTIFAQSQIQASTVVRRLSELAFLCPGLEVELLDESSGSRFVQCSPTGLRAMVTETARGLPQEIGNLVEFDGTTGDIRVRFCVGLLNTEDPRRAANVIDPRAEPTDAIRSYANSVATRQGGVHVRGLLRAFGRVKALRSEWPSSTLVGVIAVDAPRDQLAFSGPTKDVLGIVGLDEQVEALAFPVLRRAFVPVTLDTE